MKIFFPLQKDEMQASLHKYNDGDWYFSIDYTNLTFLVVSRYFLSSKE